MLIRLTIFFLLFVSAAHAQYAALRQKINFQVENERFEDVMLSLAEEGNFSFSYNPAMLPVDSILSLRVEDTSIKLVLTTLLGKELQMKQNGNHFVILRTKYTVTQVQSSGAKSHVINGYIKDVNTGVSISGATVYDLSSLNSAVTDDDGFYSIEIPIKEPVVGLAVSRENLVDTTLVIENRSQQLDIPMLSSRGVGEGLSGGPDQLEKLSVVKIVAPSESIIRSHGKPPSLYRTGQISLVPTIGTNLKMSGIITNKYSLNILAGYNGATKGVEFGGLVNVTRYYVKGIQIAGLANAVGNETSGLQLAGLFNTNLGVVKGVQIAGINNLVLDSLKGVQISGVNNIISKRTDGVQIAGVNNLALNNVDGVQLAGVSNVALKDVNKLQIAGVMNFGRNIPGGQIAGVMNTSYGKVGGVQIAGVLNSAKTVGALQLAGVMNIAVDSIHGAQIAGVFNFSRKTSGFQLGLVNMGDSVAGASIGLLNLFWRGYNKAEIHYNEVFDYNFNLKLGSHRFYNIFGLSTQGFDRGQVWGYTYGFGSAFRLGRKGHTLNIDVTATDLQDDDTWFERVIPLARLEIEFGFAITRGIMIYGGPVLNNLLYKQEFLEDDAFILDIPPYVLYNGKVDEYNVNGWVGFEVGLRFF